MKTLFIFSLLIIILTFNSYASSMGVTPPINRIIHTGEEVLTGQITIFSGEEKNIRVYVEETPLYDYITIEGGQKEITTHMYGSTLIKYEIHLPEVMKPGNYKTTIAAEQYFTPEERISTGTFGGVAAVGFIVHVRVPNEGKFLETSFSIAPGSPSTGETVFFTVNLLNFGTLDLYNLQTETIVRDPEGAILNRRLTTKLPNLPKGRSGEIKSFWETEGYGAGHYTVEADIDYGGALPATPKTSFGIGDVVIKITNVSAPYTPPVSKVIIDIESNWNRKIKNVFAEIVVQKNKQVINTIKTSSLDLDPWASGKLEGFWETTGLEPGNYDLDITVHYANKEAKDSIRVNIPTPEEEKDNNTLLIVTISILAVILIINLFWFLLKFKKKKKK